jgi:uncharacterized protein
VTHDHFLAPVLRTTGPWSLGVAGRAATLATRPELAGTSSSRTRGLLGRDALEDGGALIIAPCQGVHTFGMRFSLDLVGVARDGRVVKIRPEVPRGRVMFSLKSFAIVELPAGTCAAVGLVLGDRLECRTAPVTFQET